MYAKCFDVKISKGIIPLSSLLCHFDWVKSWLTPFWYITMYRLIVPLILTFFTIYIIYPIITATIYKKYTKELSKLKKIKKEAENLEILTVDEGNKIKNLHIELENEVQKLKLQVQQERIHIKNLNKQFEKSQEKINNLEQERANLNSILIIDLYMI
jgi:septation ring formation regulator EzrA